MIMMGCQVRLVLMLLKEDCHTHEGKGIFQILNKSTRIPSTNSRMTEFSSRRQYLPPEAPELKSPRQASRTLCDAKSLRANLALANHFCMSGVLPPSSTIALSEPSKRLHCAFRCTVRCCTVVAPHTNWPRWHVHQLTQLSLLETVSRYQNPSIMLSCREILPQRSDTLSSGPHSLSLAQASASIHDTAKKISSEEIQRMNT